MNKRLEEEGKRLTWDKKLRKHVEPEKFSKLPGLKYCTFPTEPLEMLVAQKRDATWALLLNITRLWFFNFQQNPVKLASTEIRGFKVSKNQKARALVALEKSGLIDVERQPRKSPLVTLTWKPVKK
jgi:hypothetical protein